MATYILLLTLSPEGRQHALHDPESVRRAQDEISIPGVQVLGVYGVLGEYDFVSIVEADDNQSIARFSLELGVRADAHITTLPAIPIGRLGAQEQPDLSWAEASITPSTSGDRPDEPEDASGQSTDPPVPAS